MTETLVMVSKSPRRIVSLVPSLTETICEMGLSDELVGVTSFCVHPPKINSVRIGGTKNPDIEAILKLNPTHVLANMEENRASDVERLSNFAPTLVTNPSTVWDVPEMLKQIYQFLEFKSSILSPESINFRLQSLEENTEKTPLTEALYFIWQNPYMSVGTDTYIYSAMQILGFLNLTSETRYPTIQLEDYRNRELSVLLSSEPFPFRKRQAESMRKVLGNAAKFYKIDGKIMSWYGYSTFELLDYAEKKRSTANLIQEIF